MPPLASDLRGQLENAVKAARKHAEAAADAALTTLAARESAAYPTMGDEAKAQRVALRARARQLGDGVLDRGFPLLVEEIAYAQWHRMLFARFLAENDLLMHPDGVPISLGDCADLAREQGEGDQWTVAAVLASAMLPGLFAPDGPSVQVRFAREGQAALEQVLAELPAAAFQADDALGWVYQFWQSDRKKAVSSGGKKIGGADLSAYSQLFTEDYMVRFLLENTLGAWWAARHPESRLVRELTYLRRREDSAPAAGSFPGWPDRAAELTVMDPCCGSGHFLVNAFGLVRQMRMEEEGLGAAAAGDAVLRDNLFGLELDPRCTQIAAFALALTAWKSGGYRPLPLPNMACSGISAAGQLDEWLRLAGKDVDLRRALERLHALFSHAGELGSLIDPGFVPLEERMFAADAALVETTLEYALASAGPTEDPAAHVFGAAARGAAHAVALLARRYDLVATNVPYLGRGSQTEILHEFCRLHHPAATGDLATAFVERCQAFTAPGGTSALVTPQSWLFLGTYKAMRKEQLETQTWNLAARLGPGAFETISGGVVNVVLLALTNRRPDQEQMLAGLDVSNSKHPAEKAAAVLSDPLEVVSQQAQLGINKRHESGVGYPSQDDAAEAKENIDAVLKRLKALHSALKPQVIQLFRGNVHTSVAGAKSSRSDTGQIRDEAWATFTSKPDDGWGPALRVGLTPEHCYWGFSLGGYGKEVQASWARGEQALVAARTAGARIFLIPLDGEPYEVDSPPAGGAQHHGVLVGWLADKNDPILRNPGLVGRIANDFALFRPSVELLLEDGDPSKPPVPPVDGQADPWAELARTTYTAQEVLLDIEQLLNERRQLIFYGPPGTGKTFVAKQFGRVFTEDPTRVQVVQFHPSYSYEEFVEGLRPKSNGGQLTYDVEPGVIRRFAATAANDSENRYLLIIDELNRANLSKVFGELFYLLEYRDDEIELPYSREKFKLPSNLFVIGTMNTSDRSIALVDFALRRRFGFVPFYPDEALLQLRAYLARHDKQEYAYVADMLAEVNRAIEDRDYRLGHSYFMLAHPEQLDYARIERTWRYSIEPYLREYWFGRDAAFLDNYTFENVRKRVEPQPLVATPPPPPAGEDSVLTPEGDGAPA